MTFSTDLRRRTIEALTLAAIFPAKRLFDSRPVPTERDELPAGSVFTLARRGEAVSAAFQTAPEFDTRITLTVEFGLDGGSDDAVAAMADQYCERIVDALLTSSMWLRLMQGVPAYSTEVKLNVSTDKRTAGGTVTFEIAINETFNPSIVDELRTVRVGVDVIDPAADPNIRYPGPDGRIEVELEISLPSAS